ncbi:MAG: ribosome assembly RNA-binding protein YhbY [Lachnospiraceae bacterium]|nr:ribosome assembly RNA-binding protein YhbY [Lachnospiraceae bacterium]
MLNSKQRAYLMKMASSISPIFQIGKSSLTSEIIEAVDAALEKRELIKISVLRNCADDPKELSEMIAERTRSQVVQVIGKKIVLFRVSKKKPVIELPKT